MADMIFNQVDGGVIVDTMSQPGHKTMFELVVGGETTARCECGATWTYDKERDFSYIVSIYESHLKYANRPKLETL